jgi:predicted permease
MSYPDYVRFRDRLRTVEGLAAHYSTSPLFVTRGNRAEEINGAVVSANFFSLLGLVPEEGRFFRNDEDQVPDRDRVAVVSHEFRTTWLEPSTSPIGQDITLNGVSFTVIGVVNGRFRGLSPHPSEVYIPTMMLGAGYRWCDDALAADCTILDLVGRLAPGRTIDEALAEAQVAAPPAWASAREGDNSGVTVLPLQGIEPSEDANRVVSLLAGVSAVMLVVCCLNLAGLVTARASARSRDQAVRTAIGASRRRLAQQMMTESLLVAGAGGALGIALSIVTTRVIDALFFARDSEGHLLRFDFSLEPSIVLAVAAVVVGVAVGFGLAPALKWSRIGVLESLRREGGGQTGRLRSGYWLVGAQAGFAVTLLAIAGLLIGSARELATGMNYAADRIALMRLRPRLMHYTSEKAMAFQRRVLTELSQTPGVQSVSLVGTGVVLAGGESRVWLPAWSDPARQALDVGFIDTGSDYFTTLGTPIVAGREFDDRDGPRAPLVAVVNESLARRLWPQGAALGAPIVVDGRERRVVGVVADVPLQSRAEPTRPYVYVPYWQQPDEVDARYCIRVSADPSGMLPALVSAVHRVDPDVPIAEAITLPVQLAGMFTPVRVSALLLTYAAGFAALLCVVGLYAAVAYSLSRRTKEIGIRSAVGATPGQVLTLIVRESMTFVLAGTVIGGFAAVGSTGLVRHLLFGLRERDTFFYAAAMTAVTLIGLCASALPARRAALMPPMTALRQE